MSWAVADQAVSSGTNFFLAAAMARALNAQGFGAFAVALTAYVFAQGVARALCGEPAMIMLSARPPDETSRAVAGVASVAMIVGLCFAGILVLAAVAFQGAVGAGLLVLGAGLPLLLLQDCWRHVAFARGTPVEALKNDLVWAFVQVPCLVALIFLGTSSLPVLMASWVLAAGVAALIGTRQFDARPSLWAAREWIALSRPLSGRLAAEFVAQSGSAQVALSLIGVVVGVEAFGAIRGAIVLLGPMNALLLAATGAAIPEAVRVLQASPSRFRVFIRRTSLALAIGAVVYSAAALVMPDDLGRTLLGDTWVGSRAVLEPQVTRLVLAATTLGPLVGLRAAGAAGRTVSVRFVVAGPLILFGFVGAHLGGTNGAVWGLAAIDAVAMLMFWGAHVQVMSRWSPGPMTPRVLRSSRRRVARSLREQSGDQRTS